MEPMLRRPRRPGGASAGRAPAQIGESSEEAPRPVAEPYREPEKVGASRAGIGPGLGFDGDERELREIRPSFNSDRPYDLPYAED